MSRPERRNAMTAAFWKELQQIVHGLDAGGETRVLVLSSSGPHFCAGLDVSMFSSGALTTKRKDIGARIIASAATVERAKRRSKAPPRPRVVGEDGS